MPSGTQKNGPTGVFHNFITGAPTPTHTSVRRRNHQYGLLSRRERVGAVVEDARRECRRRVRDRTAVVARGMAVWEGKRCATDGEVSAWVGFGVY